MGRREAYAAGRGTARSLCCWTWDGENLLLLDRGGENLCFWMRDIEKPLLLDRGGEKPLLLLDVGRREPPAAGRGTCYWTWDRGEILLLLDVGRREPTAARRGTCYWTWDRGEILLLLDVTGFSWYPLGGTS